MFWHIFRSGEKFTINCLLCTENILTGKQLNDHYVRFHKRDNKNHLFLKKYLTGEKKPKQKNKKKTKKKNVVIAFIDHERIRNIPEFVKHHSKGRVQSYEDE